MLNSADSFGVYSTLTVNPSFGSFSFIFTIILSGRGSDYDKVIVLTMSSVGDSVNSDSLHYLLLSFGLSDKSLYEIHPQNILEWS